MRDTIKLQKPDAGQTTSIVAVKKTNLEMTFSPADATLIREGNNLVFSFADDSNIKVTDFYAIVTKDALPDFIVEGQTLSGAVFFANLVEDRMPAANPAAAGTDARFYDLGVADLMGGTTALGGLASRGGTTQQITAEASSLFTAVAGDADARGTAGFEAPAGGNSSRNGGTDTSPTPPSDAASFSDTPSGTLAATHNADNIPILSAYETPSLNEDYKVSLSTMRGGSVYGDTYGDADFMHDSSIAGGDFIHGPMNASAAYGDVEGIGGAYSNDTLGASLATFEVPLNGGTGEDYLLGGAGDDQLFGGVDDSFLYGGAGNTALYGGADDNILVYSATNTVMDGSELFVAPDYVNTDTDYLVEPNNSLLGGFGTSDTLNLDDLLSNHEDSNIEVFVFNGGGTQGSNGLTDLTAMGGAAADGALNLSAEGNAQWTAMDQGVSLTNHGYTIVDYNPPADDETMQIAVLKAIIETS